MSTAGRPARPVSPKSVSRPPWPLRLERAYLPVALLVLSSIPFLVNGQPDDPDSLNPLAEVTTGAAQGDTLKQVILLSLYGISAILVFWRAKPRLALFVGVPMLCLLAWTFASVGWSGEPSITIRRCIAVAGTVLLGVHLAARFDAGRMLTMLSNTFFILLVISLLVALGLPNRGLDIEGRLRGVFEHKNSVGAVSAVTALLFVSRLVLARRLRSAHVAYAVFGIALSLVMLGWSHSAGPIPAFAVGCACLIAAKFLPAIKGLSATLMPAFAALGLVVVGIAVTQLASGEGAAALGRDSDLSGRTIVWAFTLKVILQQPLLGYGYQTFWEAANVSSSAQVFWTLSKIAVRHSHDGYLQLTLDLGLIGLACLLCSIGTMIGRLVRLLRSSHSPKAIWICGFVPFLLVLNIGETRLWVGNDILVVLLAYAVTRVNIEYRVAFPVATPPIRHFAPQTAPGGL